MKNIFKISVVLFIGFSIVFSSCKKEIDGCTDGSAMNYASDANSDDGSCVFAYDLAQGKWNIDPTCDSVGFKIFGQVVYTLDVASIFPSTSDISGNSQNVISLEINSDSLGIEESFLADVTNNGIITLRDNQSFDIDGIELPDFGSLNMTVKLSGSGNIDISNTGTLALQLEFVPSIALLSTESSTCQIIFIR